MIAIMEPGTFTRAMWQLLASRKRLCDIQTATGHRLDALAGIPERPSGMSDQELRERLMSGKPVP